MINQKIMKAVIVEDEVVAAQNIERILNSLDKNIVIEAVLQSVEESVEWFDANDHPDVVFMDIHLADGDSFAIFDATEIRCPIIFTTAYDEYALKAFEVNSIDYLLKPIDAGSLSRALTKLEQFSFQNNNSDLVSQIMQSIEQSRKSYKKHFLIPYRDKLIPLAVDDIAYIYSEMKAANIVCFDKKEFVLDTSLDELLRQLDPTKFYRANRQYIVSHRAVADLSIWFGGKLAVNLSVPTNERIIVSRAKNNEFKTWFTENENFNS